MKNPYKIVTQFLIIISQKVMSLILTHAEIGSMELIELIWTKPLLCHIYNILKSPGRYQIFGVNKTETFLTCQSCKTILSQRTFCLKITSFGQNHFFWGEGEIYFASRPGAMSVQQQFRDMRMTPPVSNIDVDSKRFIFHLMVSSITYFAKRIAADFATDAAAVRLGLRASCIALPCKVQRNDGFFFDIVPC